MGSEWKGRNGALLISSSFSVSRARGGLGNRLRYSSSQLENAGWPRILSQNPVGFAQECFLIEPMDGQANREHFEEIGVEGQFFRQSLHVANFIAASRASQHVWGLIDCRNICGQA
jgi:hypothetical protein